MNWLRYIGNAAARVLSHLDLSKLGAEVAVLEKLGENKAITFARGVAQHVEPEVADFIANHPALRDEFTTLTEDEVAAEQAARTGNPSSGGSSSNSTGDQSSPATSSGNEPSAASSTDPSAPAATAPSSPGSSPEATA